MSWWCPKRCYYRLRDENLEADLVPYGISPAEMKIMHAIAQSSFWDGILMFRADLAVTTYEALRYWKGLHCEDYLHAIDRLLERGLLLKVTAEKVEEWRTRRAAEEIPSCEDKDLNYRLLMIDFTQAGYEVYGRIQRELYGRVRLGRRLDTTNHTVLILSEDESAVRECADWMADEKGPSPFETSQSTLEHPIEAQLKRTVGPTRIGPWRLSRFEVVPSGFMMVLEYE